MVLVTLENKEKKIIECIRVPNEFDQRIIDLQAKGYVIVGMYRIK